MILLLHIKLYLICISPNNCYKIVTLNVLLLEFLTLPLEMNKVSIYVCIENSSISNLTNINSYGLYRKFKQILNYFSPH